MGPTVVTEWGCSQDPRLPFRPDLGRLARMTVSLPAPVQAVFDATNAGDTEAFLAAFSADGVVDDWGREFHGHAAIKQWSDGENIGVHATFAVTAVTAHDGEY